MLELRRIVLMPLALISTLCVQSMTKHPRCLGVGSDRICATRVAGCLLDPNQKLLPFPFGAETG